MGSYLAVPMRILISGGAGFLGSHVAGQLLAGHAGAIVRQIIILDNFSRGRREHLSSIRDGRLSIIEGDIRDRSLVQQVMRGIDCVLHLASMRSRQCQADPQQAAQVIACGAVNIAEAATAAKVRKVIVGSSAAVYGQAEILPTPESHHPHFSRSVYAAAKLFVEGIFRSYEISARLAHVTLRYFNLYGPRMAAGAVDADTLVRWIDSLECGIGPAIHGSGEQTMDLLAVEDAARATVAAMVSPVRDEAFNIGSGREIALDELLENLQRIMGTQLRIRYRADEGAGRIERRCADISKAAGLLNFKPEIELEEGLTRLVRWWKSTRTATIPV